MAIKTNIENSRHGNSKRTLVISNTQPEDSIGYKLYPKTPKSFSTIFGRAYSLENVIKYVMLDGYKPAFINNRLNKADYAYIKRLGLRKVPNYWNIVTMLVADRLFADRELLEQINKEYDNIDDLFAVIYVTVRRGVVKEEVPNEKLRTLSIILGNLIKDIIKAYRENNGDDVNIAELNLEDFRNTKLKVKEAIFSKITDHNKSDRLLDGISDTTDEEVKKAFLK